jgi:hypothetical protein
MVELALFAQQGREPGTELALKRNEPGIVLDGDRAVRAIAPIRGSATHGELVEVEEQLVDAAVRALILLFPVPRWGEPGLEDLRAETMWSPVVVTNTPTPHRAESSPPRAAGLSALASWAELPIAA